MIKIINNKMKIGPRVIKVKKKFMKKFKKKL